MHKGGRQRGCRTPSVKNCLNCTKEECDVVATCTQDISEIKALIYVGMMPSSSLSQHYAALRRAEKRRKSNENCA